MSESASLVRLPVVEEMTGFKKSALYQMVAEKRFPAPRRIGLRAVAWRVDEVEKWIEERPPVLARGPNYGAQI